MAEKWVLSSLILGVVSLSMLVNAAVPAVFILGDSTADVGTNNHLETSSKANFLYNGIDFPGSTPTGRFSNGLNNADTVCKTLGFRRSPPPYLGLLNQNVHLSKHVLRGVNFASGASGLLNGTGSRYGKVVSLDEQIQQFAIIRNVLIELWGQWTTDSFLSKSLFFISVGSNDVIENYASNPTANKQEFVTILESSYESQLKGLYSLGARKFGIMSVPPIGCCPSQRAQNTTGGCLEDLNEYSRLFFLSTQFLLKKLSSEFKDIKYALGNAYEMVINFMENPLPFGFRELKTACCGNGTFNGQAPCTPSAKLCSKRDEYLFWDMYHPTQAAAHLAALTLYGGAPRFVTPINFKQLAELN